MIKRSNSRQPNRFGRSVVVVFFFFLYWIQSENKTGRLLFPEHFKDLLRKHMSFPALACGWDIGQVCVCCNGALSSTLTRRYQLSSSQDKWVLALTAQTAFVLFCEKWHRSTRIRGIGWFYSCIYDTNPFDFGICLKHILKI